MDILRKIASAAVFVALMCGVAACEDDEPVMPVPEPDVPVEVKGLPTEDVILTRLQGNVAMMGTQFDDITERVLARASSVTQIGSSLLGIPPETDFLFIDAATLSGYMENFEANIDELSLLRARYMAGLTVCLHEPNDLYAIEMMIYLDLLDMISEEDGNIDVTARAADVKSRARQSLRERRGVGRESRAGGYGDPDATCDLWVIRRGGHELYIPDLHKEGAAYTVGMGIIENEGEENESRRDSTLTFIPAEPTAYQYGLFAEYAVEWLNETEKTVVAKARKIFSRAEMDYDEVASDTHLINATGNWDWAKVDGWNWTAPSSSQPLVMPIRVRVWVTAAYNFSQDQDYYHIVTEEDCNAKGLNFGYITWPELKDFHTYYGTQMTPSAAGATFRNMTVCTRWPYDDYKLLDEWNMLPNEGAAESTTETVSGWQLNSDVSFGKGVTGKFSGSYTNKTTVSSVNKDVHVVMSSDQSIDGHSNWIKWDYTFANQISLSKNGLHTDVKYTPVDTSATSVSRKSQHQSWNWVVDKTSKRGAVPFVVPLKFQSVGYRCVMATKLFSYSMSSSFTSVDLTTVEPEFALSERTYNITLPVPERVRKKFTLEVENIWNESEYSDLEKNLNRSSNFKALATKLSKVGDDDNPVWPAGITEASLEKKLSYEWYQVAKDILVSSKHPGLSNTYRFRVRDDNGKLLPMYTTAGKNGKIVGTYLEISPEGNFVSYGDEVPDYAKGDAFIVQYEGGSLIFKVTNPGKECELETVAEDYKGPLNIPSEIQGLTVTSIGSSAVDWGHQGLITELSVPGSVKVVPTFAFYHLKTINKAVFGEGFEKLEMGAFSFAAREVYFPTTFREYGLVCFCWQPDVIHFAGTTPPECDSDKVTKWNSLGDFENTVVKVPSSALETYRKHPVWGLYKKLQAE